MIPLEHWHMMPINRRPFILNYSDEELLDMTLEEKKEMVQRIIDEHERFDREWYVYQVKHGLLPSAKTVEDEG